MHSLKTKQKLTILFTLYFSLFLVILGGLFLTIFHYTLRNQAQKDLTHEFGEIISDHIRMGTDGITFKKDKNGDTLRTHLFNDGISAQFIGSNGAIIRNYGTFELQVVNEKDNRALDQVKKTALLKKTVIMQDIEWNALIYSSLITPLQYNNKTIGLMVIAKSLEDTSSLMYSTVLILALLGGIGMMGSFLLGYVFTHNALHPLSLIMSAIEGTDLNKLQHAVEIKGHPEDEFVLLAHTFNSMLERITLMSQQQREFIANASHELKTPLTRAISTIDVLSLKRDINRAELQEVKTDIFEINELIDTLLVLGKINETNLPRGESDLNEIIKAVCNQQGQYYNDKKIQFTVSLHPFPLPLPTEYAKVLFNNLVSNAIKFSPHHTKITISCDPQNKTISVEDNGAGITDEEQKKIFDRFYRGNEMRSKVKGYGLGLSLVKEICNEYGIKIMITSSKGVGTTVQLSF